MTFIEEHKDRRVDGGLRWGVEPICQVLTEHNLAIAPATYYAAKTRTPSARAVRDGELKPVIERVHKDNYGVYGVRKVHAGLRREGIDIGRDQTGRLLRELGLAGVRRGKVKRTTLRDEAAARPADLVNRDFHASRPDQLWVCDLTYIRTWAGFTYLALVIDVYSRRIVGWALAPHMRTGLPLEPWSWRSGPGSSSAWTGWSTTPTVSMGGPVLLGFLTLTPMDASGCWCQVAPGLPDPHFRLTTVVFPRICRWPGSTW